MKHLKFILISIFSIFFITVLIKIFFIQIYIVENDSMYKTILPGNKLIVSKISHIRKGDIVLYQENDELNISRLVAQQNDSIIISGQEIYVNDKEASFKHQTKSYCFRFIDSLELNSIKQKYPVLKLNNSGFFQVELTKYEYDEIMKDSISELKQKIFPVERCIHEIFSLEEKIGKIVVNKDFVFVLNDNRSNHNDSRTLGLIDKKNIIGRVIYVFTL